MQQSRHVIDVTLEQHSSRRERVTEEERRRRQRFSAWQPKTKSVHCTEHRAVSTAYTLFTWPLDISCEISREITQSSNTVKKFYFRKKNNVFVA